MAIKRLTLKLGNMRKPQEFVVCPRPTNVGPEYDRITIQSDKRICMIEMSTRKAVLSAQHQNGAYNHHLHPALGATLIEVEQTLIDEIKAAQPQPGDHIGQGVYVG